MGEKALFDRDKLLQHLHREQPIQDIHTEQNVQTTTVYGAERDALERAAAAGLEASKRAAAATVASEQGRTDILKGLQAGADIYRLFATACECISKTTGDTVFADQAAEYIRVIYGRALGEASPLRAELEAVQTRAQRIRQYMERDDIPASDRDAARRALQAHQREAERITAELGIETVPQNWGLNDGENPAETA